MRLKKLYTCIVIVIVAITTCNAQLNIDSLFLTTDSLTIIFTGFSEENAKKISFSQGTCYESAFHYSTNNSELISSLVEALSFEESKEILFCDYNFEFQGFKNRKQTFKMAYNSDCNYGTIGAYHFRSDTLTKYTKLKEYRRFSDAYCNFRIKELADCFVESLLTDESIELLNLNRESELTLFYRFSRTKKNNQP